METNKYWTQKRLTSLVWSDKLNKFVAVAGDERDTDSVFVGSPILREGYEEAF